MQLPKSESLLLYETSSISQGYLSIHHLLKKFDIHILEASPISPGRLMVLANPLLEDLEKAFDFIKTSFENQLIEVASIKKVQKETLLAFYSLNQTTLQEMLLVIEISSVVSAIDITNNLNQQGVIVPIEIRSSRGLGNVSLIYATFKNEHQQQIHKYLKQKKQVLDFTFFSATDPYWHSIF